MTKRNIGWGLGLLLLGALVLGVIMMIRKPVVSYDLNDPANTATAKLGVEPLQTNTPAAGETANGLSVAGGGGGQLNLPGQNQSGDAEAAKMLDPATFSQYDKYKDAETALFAELRQGEGSELTAGKKAAVYYRGWLTDGRLFDQSRTGDDGKLQPFVFAMGGRQVISGWEQGLSGMKAGGVRLLIVPPKAGYGASGQGGIPPHAVLVFQVQLLAVQ